MERKISAIIISLLLLSSIMIFVNNEQYVEATGGDGGGDIDNIGLDYDFLWNVSDKVSNAVYEAWEGDEITKGREFGSKGDIWTANRIWEFMKFNCSLENVEKIPLGPIEECPYRFYTSKINVSDYLLHIDNPYYNEVTGLPNDVPKNESFAFPQAYPQGLTGPLTFDSTMTDEENVRVIEPLTINWPAGGSLTNCYLNLSVTAANQYNLIIGNATYVADNDPLPQDQEERVLLFNEEEGECEERLENVTNASGVILIHNVTSRYNTPNASNYSFSVGRVNSSESNLSGILNMLNNSEIMIVENILCNETLTFTYNIDCEHINWPSYNFTLIVNLTLPTPEGNKNYIYWLNNGTILLRVGNLLGLLPCKGVCKGVILFNEFTYGTTYNDTHFMNVNNPALFRHGWFRFGMQTGIPIIDWPLSNIGFPGLPVYWVNYTVGSWLYDHTDWSNNTVTGYVNQDYLEEIHGSNPKAGVTAYNVIGNITTDRSSNVPDPDDPIVVISNRYDGWWSEASFDSGCGVGVVLAIGKYFNDYNINPKVNITFLEDTGEEYLFRGAQHFSDSHPDNNYSLWIGFDQLASNWTGSKLELTFNDNEVCNITKAIGEQMGYPKRTNNDYSLDPYVTLEFTGAEEDVWKQRDLEKKKGGIECPYHCKTICFAKSLNGTYGRNPFRHRRGENFTEGDLLKNIDQEDLNDTLELAWNITRYFCVNPDCWFESYSETSLDSPDDQNILNDTIKTNFTIKSTLPHDLVMVNATLINSSGVIVNQTFMNFTANRTGVQESINLTLPGYEPPGNYMVFLELYNSTGRINEIVNISYNNYNETKESPSYTFLYPFDYPFINNVSNNPVVVGFGFNITIYANVTDANLVKVNITYPDISSENCTMSAITNISTHIYQYNFNDTWQQGMYNYTIWAYSCSGGSSSFSGHSFNVSANAIINVCTLKDNYSRDEFVNITDPPNPLDDYYIVDRGLTWDKYYNASTGMNTLVVSQGPVNYQDETGAWTPINRSLNMLDTNHPAYNYGYRIGNYQGLFNVYFKPNIQESWPVVFAYNKSIDHLVRSKLLGVGYLDPTNVLSYEILQSIQNSEGQITGNSITYENVFTGTDVIWSYGNGGLKEKIVLGNTTKSMLQNHPPSDFGLSNQDSYLVFITKLDYLGLNMYNASGVLSGNFTITDSGIDFKDAMGYFKCALPLGEAYELYNNSVYQSLVYRILQYNGNVYLLSGLKLVDLNSMSFPVVIDPTLTVTSLTSDGYIYASNTDYSTAWTASSGSISDTSDYISIGQKKQAGIPTSTYYIYRGFLMFNTSELPDKANVTGATLSLYKKDDFSTTDFNLTLQNGQPFYPHDELNPSDYNKNHYSGCGGGLNTYYFADGWNNITITELDWIQHGGITKLCLRSKRDIDGTAPTSGEFVNVYSADESGEYMPKLVVTYFNQSKISNLGSTSFKGYLLMQVKYFDDTMEPASWIVANNTVVEDIARVIGVSEQFGLDTVFNDIVNTTDLLDSYGEGLYRVYAAFRDPDGDVLVCDNDSMLEATYEFTLAY